MVTSPVTPKSGLNNLAWREIIAKYQNPDLRRSLWQILNSIPTYFVMLYLMVLSLETTYWLTLVPIRCRFPWNCRRRQPQHRPLRSGLFRPTLGADRRSVFRVIGVERCRQDESNSMAWVCPMPWINC